MRKNGVNTCEIVETGAKKQQGSERTDMAASRNGVNPVCFSFTKGERLAIMKEIQEEGGFAMYMTRQRRDLLSFFSAHSDENFSAADIAEELNRTARFPISISAVYRNILLLEKEGYLTRSAGDKPRESKYRYFCANQLHLICEKCGNTRHLDKAAADRLIRSAGEEDGFSIDISKTTICGLCRNCKEES